MKNESVKINESPRHVKNKQLYKIETDIGENMVNSRVCRKK